jgi:hypothetical protein
MTCALMCAITSNTNMYMRHAKLHRRKTDMYVLSELLHLHCDHVCVCDFQSRKHHSVFRVSCTARLNGDGVDWATPEANMWHNLNLLRTLGELMRDSTRAGHLYITPSFEAVKT